MSQVTIYSTKICPNCQLLKQMLNNSGIAYNEADMGSPAALTELAMNNVFTMSAPVLRIRDRFYTTEDIFEGNSIDRQKVEDIMTNI